ncbi:MAG: hypothetical protein AAF560_16115 [Acidobacteriota bacterium]
MQPLEGYPLTASDDQAAALEEAYEALRLGGELAAAEAAAQQLLESDAGFLPARVLLAQARYWERRDQEVIAQVGPVVDELPEYTAAQLLIGGAAQRAGDVPVAFEAFAQLGDQGHEEAGQRAAAIKPRALEIVFNELEYEVGRGHVETAEQHLAWLEYWGEDSLELYRGQRLVAVEQGDLERELAAVRALGQRTGELDDLRREGQLELQIGDVRSGLDRLEALHQQFPDDEPTRDLLDEAKFLWRLQLLPADVQETGRKHELSRSDAATLLYWLVPGVRFSQVTNPPIAADILDHPSREVILKVLNLGLMHVDETRHLFEPEASATEVEVLFALLELLSSSGRFACLSDASVLDVDASWRSICHLASACQLISSQADCTPSAIAGRDALELIRRTLNLLGNRTGLDNRTGLGNRE